MYTALGYAIILIWGTCFVFMKELVAAGGANPFVPVFCVNLVAALAAMAWGLKSGELKPLVRLYRAGRARFIKLVCFNGAYHILMPLSTYLALQVQYATIANYTWPMLLVYLSARHQRRPLTGRIICSCLLGFSAVIVISIPSSFMFLKDNVAGVACAFAGAFLWASYSAQLDESIGRVRSLFQGTAHLIAALCALAVGESVSVVMKTGFSFHWLFSPRILLLLLYVSLVVTVFAYVAWIRVLVRHPRPDRFKVSVYLLPVINVVTASLWYREPFNVRIWIALALVLAGIWLVSPTSSKKAWKVR